MALTVLIIFSEEIIFDGSLTLKYSVDLSPNLIVDTHNNFLYVGIKGDAYFIGFLSQHSTDFKFSIDQVYGIFDLGFANLFLGPKVQNFKVSSFADDLWLGGTISADIPFSLGNIYVAIDPVFSDSIDPKVNALLVNLSVYSFDIHTVVYSNFTLLESGINFELGNFKLMTYGRFNLSTTKLLNLTVGGFTSFNKLDITLSITPYVISFEGFKTEVNVLYNVDKNYQIGGDFSYDTSDSSIFAKVYSNYKYKDLNIIPALVWDNQFSGSLEVNFNF